MNNVMRLLLICSVFLYVQGMYAYSFSFSNHTNRQLKVRIKLAGIAEDWIEKELAGKDDQEGRTITFEIGGRKVGFCLDKIQLSTADMPWTPAVVQWVEGTEGAQFDRMLKAAELFADGAADLAQAIVYEKADAETLKKIDAFKEKKKKIEAHAAQVMALSDILNASPEELKQMSRAELDKQVREKFIRPNMAKIKAGEAEIIAQQQKIQNILDELALDDLELTNETEAMIQEASTVGNDLAITTKEGSKLVVAKAKKSAKQKTSAKALVPYVEKEKGTQPYNYTKRLARAEQQPSIFSIASIVHVVGNLIKYSWCKSLHFDVVEDDDGIKFLVKVGQ